VFFAAAVLGYVIHGALRDTDNQLARPHRLGTRTVSPAAVGTRSPRRKSRVFERRFRCCGVDTSSDASISTSRASMDHPRRNTATTSRACIAAPRYLSWHNACD